MDNVRMICVYWVWRVILSKELRDEYRPMKVKILPGSRSLYYFNN
jgi:hypothetical protein